MRHPYTRGQRRHQFFRWRDRVRRSIKDTWISKEDNNPTTMMRSFFNPYNMPPAFVCGFLRITEEDEINKQIRWREKNRAACDCYICKRDRWNRGESRQVLKAKAQANATLEDL